MSRLASIFTFFLCVFLTPAGHSQSFENMRDFTGRYTGFLDGRNATLQISESRADRIPVLRFTLTDTDRNVSYSGIHYVPNMNARQHKLENVRLTAAGGGRRVLSEVYIHTWNTNHLSIFTPDNYGIVFSKELTPSRLRSASFRNTNDWYGTYLGSWDGRESRMIISRGVNSFQVSIQGTAPGSDRYEMSTNGFPIRTGDANHVIRNLLLGTANGGRSQIGKMMLHTWNKNYITGTSVYRDTEYGFYFVRQ